VPTLIREGGFEVRIYTLDHPPPHVHVAKAGAIAKIELATCCVVEVAGSVSDRDGRKLWSRGMPAGYWRVGEDSWES
jgi:hypothetical protein